MTLPVVTAFGVCSTDTAEPASYVLVRNWIPIARTANRTTVDVPISSFCRHSFADISDRKLCSKFASSITRVALMLYSSLLGCQDAPDRDTDAAWMAAAAATRQLIVKVSRSSMLPHSTPRLGQ